LGWNYVWKTEQTDFFFFPTGANYKKTWEILKIRKVGFNRYYFTYFWPQDNKKSYEDRYTMRFFVDYNTLLNFKELYPTDIVEITKLRRTFFLKWVLICLDQLENWDTYIMFKFEEKNGRQIILDVLEHLEIDARTWLKKSYFELINKN
jgi:predicted adenylyl cyclase CyaB